MDVPRYMQRRTEGGIARRWYGAFDAFLGLPVEVRSVRQAGRGRGDERIWNPVLRLLGGSNAFQPGILGLRLGGLGLITALKRNFDFRRGRGCLVAVSDAPRFWRTGFFFWWQTFVATLPR